MAEAHTSVAGMNRYTIKAYGISDYHDITAIQASELIRKFKEAITK